MNATTDVLNETVITWLMARIRAGAGVEQLRDSFESEQTIAELDEAARRVDAERAGLCPRCDRALAKTPSNTYIECPCPPVDDRGILREYSRTEKLGPVDVAIGAMIDAGTALGLAHAKVMQLEDERPLIKGKCIEEMIGTPNLITNKPHSATSAEAIVEKHHDYWQHRQKQIAAEIHKHECIAAFEASKLRARLMVAMASAGADQ